MAVWPVLVLTTAAVGIGLYMGVRYLTGSRNAPWLAALHLLLGAGGLEVMAMLLRGTPGGQTAAAGSFGVWAALLLAATLMSGLFVAIIVKPWPQGVGVSLLVHALVGLAGFLALLGWVLHF